MVGQAEGGGRRGGAGVSGALRRCRDWARKPLRRTCTPPPAHLLLALAWSCSLFFAPGE